MTDATNEPTGEFLQGTLDLLILKTLALGPQHGWGVSERIRQVSGGTLEAKEGSLYPALHRLVRKRWIASEWGVSENNRRARFYRLTARGRKRLAEEEATWRRLSAAVNRVLEAV
jgi:transcriptional regulator